MKTESLPRGTQIDALKNERELGGAQLQPRGFRAREGGWQLETPELEALEVGITVPSLLWRYRNCVRPGHRADRRFGFAHYYRAERLLGMTNWRCLAAIQEFFRCASCRSRRISSLSAHTIQCFPDGVRRALIQPCRAQ